jgi:YggT family protein
MAAMFELIFTATDPVLRPLDRVLPPVRIGRTAISLSFPVVFIAVSLLMGVAGSL